MGQRSRTVVREHLGMHGVAVTRQPFSMAGFWMHQVCVFWGVQVPPGGVKPRERKFQELRERIELRNVGLRALEEAWMTTYPLRHFPVKSGFCLLGRLQVVPGAVEPRPRSFLEVRGSRMLQNGGLKFWKTPG